MEPPRTEEELLERAAQLAGKTLSEIAVAAGTVAPADLKRHKGWTGQLMERCLGATAGNLDEPDFLELGIELKTLPVDRHGSPCETTFVCTVPLDEVGETLWQASRVKRKLARVLWLVVEGERQIPVPERRVGAALLWSPTHEQEAALRFDWEELAGLIGSGGIDAVSARLGRFLQVRPKAAHGRVRTRLIDAEGRISETLPRGFYLRKSFTQSLLNEHFALPKRA